MAVTVPFALVSFWNDIGAAADTVYSSNSQDASVTDQRLVLDISELDEVAGTVTMFATAARVCTPTCSTSDQLVIRSVNVDAEDLAVPVEARLTFEAMASSTSREVVLPLYGNYLHYPFDRWSLFLTVVLESAAEGDVAAPEDDVTVTQVTVIRAAVRLR